LKILVVDDDHNFTLTLCQILTLEGYSCCEAHSVDEAEKILLGDKIDLVLSDVKMPNQSGPELYYRVKNKLPNIPFILMTAYSSNEIIEEALDSGILAALPKPINIQSILDFLSKLNKGLRAALICDDKMSCRLISDFLESKKLVFEEFDSISQLKKVKIEDFSIIFIDAHYSCEHYKSKVIDLLKILPRKTIVVICDYEKPEREDKDHAIPNNLNLIILPRKKNTLSKLDKILEREFYRLAKNNIQ
jgi:CheY-like chemotaxis protein